MSNGVEQFGKYVLLERIAAGGMAEVFLSRSTGAEGVNKFLAIKRILPQYSDQQEFNEMFKEEAKLAINLRHSNVVSIYDFDVERSQFFIVMEYVEGKNLRQILNELKKTNTQLLIEQIVFIIKEVSSGLDHAHRCLDGTTGKPLNIVHRDMSPQNIMISFEGEVKIIDFGIAKAETQLELTKAGTLKGKYGYMSPEQADGQSVDARTDIFSLGIVMWELLANDRLFTASNEAAILRKIRDCQVPSIRKINPSVPAELEKIINKALARDRSLRYQTASALYKDLNRFLNTHYPDFSPQDFSVFMKNAFSTAFLDQKKKMVEFSKVQSNQIEESTVIFDNGKQSAPPPLPNSLATTLQRGDAPEATHFLNVNTETSNQVNLSGLKPLQRQTEIHKSHAPTMQNSQNNPTSRMPSGDNYFRKKQRAFPISIVIQGALIFLAVVGIYNYYPYFFDTSEPKSAQNTPHPQPTTVVKETQQGSAVLGSQGTFSVSISSLPDRARIFIDDKDTGDFTPTIISAKANTPFTLKLVKEGYADYINTVTPTYEPYSFKASMEKLSKVGSLVITINNGGVSPELFINGVPVPVKPLDSSYLIPAEVPIKIQAINRTTGLSDEKNIIVPADQKRFIELLLK